MQASVSVEFVFWVVAALLALNGLQFWWNFASRKAVFSEIATINRRCEREQRDLSTYKISVGRDFASVGHLQEVEARITGTLEKIDETLQAVAASLNRMEGYHARVTEENNQKKEARV